MTLRKQTLVIILLTTVTLVVVLYAALHLTVLRTFADLEEHFVRQNVERVVDAISYELSDLNKSAADWAEWDDTYAFVGDGNPRYIKEYLNDETYGILRINCMLFFDTAGRFVFGKGYDLEKKEEVSFPPELKEIVLASPRLLHHSDEKSGITGIILLSQGPVFVASRPVLNSQHRGPVRGTLVMGRYFNAEEVGLLSKKVQLQIEVRNALSPEMPSDFREALQAISTGGVTPVKALTEDSVAGYALLRDIFGTPASMLRVETSRQIHRQGQSTIVFFLLSVLVASAVYGAVMLAILERRILARLIGLGRNLARIAASGNPSERVTVTGSDELSGLADEINRSLNAVENAQSALRQSEERFSLVLAGTNDGVWDWDLTTDVIQRDSRWAAMLGYVVEEIEPSREAWKRLVFPEDLPRMAKAVEDHMNDRSTSYEAEYRLLTKSGQWKWILDRGKVVARDEQGKPLRMAGTHSDISERKRAEESFRRATAEAVRFQEVLLDLAKADKTDYVGSIETLLRQCARTLEVERVGFWSVASDLRSISCERLYLLSQDRFEAPGDLVDAEKLPRYLESLTQFRSIAADSARTDDRTSEFTEFYLKPLGITSMLDVPVWLHGGLAGVVCHEHVGPERRWKPREQAFAGAIADMITLTLEAKERKRAEQALKESEEKYRLVVEHANDAIVVVREGVIRFVNPRAEELMGLPGERLVSRPFLDFLHPDDREAASRRYQKRLQGNPVPGPFTFRVIDSAGNIRWMEGSPVSVDWEGQTGTLNFLTDVTAKRKIEEDVLRLEKMRSIGLLAGGIAHDFNNILTAILGNISLARAYSAAGSKAVERLGEAEKACLQAQGLTQQLLTFSRGGAPVKKVIDIGPVVRDSCLLALRGSNVRLDLHIPDDVWPIEADEGQIAQVISNIVINADHAMPEGGEVRVDVENVVAQANDAPLTVHGSYVKISIADHGVGIPREHLSKIFDPYFTTKHKGSGLGLATAYSVVKNHAGHIIAESQPTVGSTFYVYLPASEKAPLEQRDALPQVIKGQGRILLMDDEELVRDLAAEMLSFLGYHVVLAREGNEAIELYTGAKIRSEPFDVVIMDLTIPGGMGGKETIERLLDFDPDIKAIVSSGYSNDPVMAEYKKHGFTAVVAKPYDIAEISRAVGQVIEARRHSPA